MSHHRHLLFCWSLLLAAPTFAAKPTIDQIANDVQSTKKMIVDDEVKQRKIMSSLFDINRKMKKIVSDRGGMVQERMLLEGSTHELAQKIVSLEDKMKTQKAFLRERLAVIYRFGGQGVVRLLFSSSSSSQLERNLKILGVVAKRDLDLIKDYSTSVKELEKKKTKLQQRLAHLKKIESKIKTQEDRLSQENSYKNRILDGIRKSKKFALTKLTGLREKGSQMAENLAADDDSGVLDLLFRPSFFEQKGQLSPPVAGPILQSFGLMRDEENNVTLSHKGVFYSTPQGTPVKSVFSGVVAFVGSLPGFGQTLILDHGDHYYTVYSHNKNINVTVGQEVEQNQAVATAGFNPELSKDGIYFEVRHFSEPYDPSSWMKGSPL